MTTAEYALRAGLPSGWIVRTQQPVSLDEESEPEPDLVVVPGRPGDYRHAHPAGAALTVEVAHASLQFDRCDKGSLYARAAVEDYWIVNLVDRGRYRSVTTLAPPATVVPLALASSRISVADLLP